MTGLTDAYVTSEYGPQPAQPQDVRRARMHWRRLERLLSRKGRAGSVETEGRDGDEVFVASAKPTTSGTNESIRPPRDL